MIKREKYPIYPTSLNESISQLKNMLNNDLCLFKSDKFVFVPETNGFVCITTSQIRTYNGQFYRTHPLTHIVISVLKETQTRTATTMKSIGQNIAKTMANKDYDRIISTINSYRE